MTFKGITVSVEAYDRLKSLKAHGESFSKVLLRELREPGTSQDDVVKALRTLQRASAKMVEDWKLESPPKLNKAESKKPKA